MLNNKKLILSFVGLLFLSLFVLNFVSAYGFGGTVIDRAAYQIQPIAQFFLGGYDYTGYFLFERFLIFLIILSITFVSLIKAPFFEKQKNVVIVLSVVVPMLSVRYINFEWINTILMSYQVLGIALTSIIPFMIYFFFLMGVAKEYPGVRKIGWILYGCVYLGLYSTADNVFYGQVYIWTALGALIFFLLDKTIQNYFNEQKLRYSMNKHLLKASMDLLDERKQIISNYGPDPKDYNVKRRLKEIDDSLKSMNKNMGA